MRTDNKAYHADVPNRFELSAADRITQWIDDIDDEQDRKDMEMQRRDGGRGRRG